MASYKQKCMMCGTLIDRDVRFCPQCTTPNPFGYHCPSCLQSIEKGQSVCSNCGRPLYVYCIHCNKLTFVQDTCEACGRSLMFVCKNKRCGVQQFFQNTKCTACGKKIKYKKP